ncbi:MAG: mechanosensitive ion channel family protein [Actinomycetota bacterium]|nr:mechanosensitive ion channel family protein [Actinomycetota bacterium]
MVRLTLAASRQFIDLVVDNETVAGRLVTSMVVVVAGVLIAAAVGRLLARRADDVYARYYARKLTRYAVAMVVLLALAVVWRAFAGRVGVVLGLATAGLAFAMQEVVGAVAGWFNIVSGRIFRVGDRIQMGGVRGDVIDITRLRTKVMDIGSDREDESWVQGRQFTGRIVAISNKATFTEPVFNYSAAFEFIWEELTVPVAHRDDWHRAEEVIAEEARRVSASEGARKAIDAMAHRYPVPRAEVEPRVFVRATDNYMELSARFTVPVRTARTAKDALTRQVMRRLADAGIPVASTSEDVTVRHAGEDGQDARARTTRGE